MIQADPNSRTNLESLNSVKVRNGNEMAPITQFMSVKRIYGPDNIKRFNMFTAMTINGSPADGYSSGQAIQAMQEVAEQTLPTGYGYEFSGMTREEQKFERQYYCDDLRPLLRICLSVAECTIRKLYSSVCRTAFYTVRSGR